MSDDDENKTAIARHGTGTSLGGRVRQTRTDTREEVITTTE